MSRTPLKDRVLPDYTREEERANMITHIIGGATGIVIFVFSILFAIYRNNPWGLVGGIVYGVSTVGLFTVSGVYHGLKKGTAKKVMQVIDHCTIYIMIAGTYTPILLSSLRPVYPVTAWIIFGAEWAIAAFATVFTAIDHSRYGKLSMICYIVMGWFIAIALKPTITVLGKDGFIWLLAGGIFYTVGAVLYGMGKKKPIYHTVFHIFVNIGSILQAVCILQYVI